LPVICRLLHCLAPLIFLCQLQLVLQHAYQRELSVDLQLKSHFQWWFLMRCTSVVVHNLFIFTFILFRLHISWALQYKEECQRWICGSIFSFPVYEILKRNFCYSIFLNWVKDYFFHVFVHMMILICAIVKTWRSYFKLWWHFFLKADIAMYILCLSLLGVFWYWKSWKAYFNLWVSFAIYFQLLKNTSKLWIYWYDLYPKHAFNLTNCWSNYKLFLHQNMP